MRLTRRLGKWDRLGAGPGASLPSDVLIAIFEELNHTLPDELPGLRIISKQVDAVVVPIMYRRRTLSYGLVACFNGHRPKKGQAQVARDVCHHTKEIIINEWPFQMDVICLLQSLQDLRYLQCSIREPGLLSDAVVAQVFSTVSQRWPDAELAIEELNPTGCSVRTLNDANVPLSQIVSCQIDDPRREYSGRGAIDRERATIRSIVKILKAMPHLQWFHLKAGSSFRNFRGDISWDDMPPIKELILENDYQWSDYQWSNPQNWSLSNLTHLQLKDMNMAAFLDQIPPVLLPNLRHFANSDILLSCALNRRLLEWVTELRILETLKIQCSMPNQFLQEALAQHAYTLRTLEIREAQDMHSKQTQQWPMQIATQLLELPSQCFRLRCLALDVNPVSKLGNRLSLNIIKSSLVLEPWDLCQISPQDTTAIRNCLLHLKYLRKLTVFVRQPYIADLDDNRARSQSTQIWARWWIRQLIKSEVGALLEEVAIQMEVEVPRRYQNLNSWAAHSTYVYEGVSGNKSEPVVKEVMQEQNQHRVEIQ